MNDVYYHIYNRGVNKDKIFHDKNDYERFINLIEFCNNDRSGDKYRDIDFTQVRPVYDQIVAIGAYVLMPNHFHFLIKETVKDGASKFMKKISTAYAMYFNKKYERTGALFEGRFKSRHVDSDEYLKYLYAYIYMNPLKLKDKDWKTNVRFHKKAYLDFLKKYEYSSFFPKHSPEVGPLGFPKYFGDKSGEKIEKHALDWIDIYISQEIKNLNE
jgi:putative transposase